MSLEACQLSCHPEGIAYHGSNGKGSFEAAEAGYFRQLEVLPPSMLESMVGRIGEGIQRFDNIDYDVNILAPADLTSAIAPSIGQQQWVARLVLEGAHSFGVKNPNPWDGREAETITYAIVTAIIWQPDRALARIVESETEFAKWDTEYLELKDNEKMRSRIDGVHEVLRMIIEGKRFQTVSESATEPQEQPQVA